VIGDQENANGQGPVYPASLLQGLAEDFLVDSTNEGEE
jgi:hypothetical protein